MINLQYPYLGVKLFERDFLEKYLLEPICALDLSPKLVKFARAGFISLINPVCELYSS